MNERGSQKNIDDKYLAIGLGVFFILLIIVIFLFIPCPSSPLYNILRIVIAIAVAGIATILPGTFQLKIHPFLTATGALAVFGFVYYFDPAQLNAPNNCPDVFELTVYVCSPTDKNDRPLKSKGKVTMDLGSDARDASIGPKGEAHFLEIPLKFWKKTVSFGLTESDIYKPAKSDTNYVLDGNPIYLPVKPYSLDVVTGTVKNENQQLLEGATIRINTLEATTDKNGFFKLTIPENLQKREQQVTIVKNGYQVWEGTVTPETGEELRAILRK